MILVIMREVNYHSFMVHIVNKPFYKSIENKKPSPEMKAFLRGLVRIRTGVDGFADRCLAARPRDLVSGRKNSNFSLMPTNKLLFYRH